MRLPKLGLGELRQQWRVLYKAAGALSGTSPSWKPSQASTIGP